MTMGELAEMINSDEHLGVRLEIVRMAGYDRRAYLDETDLRWWPPSPNLRSVVEALLYPAVGLLEATNVSVGRGTETPFEVLGAPWIDGPALAEELAGSGLAGISIEAADFIPSASPYKNTPCHGIRVRVTDRTSFEPVRTGITIAAILHKLYRSAWSGERMRGMLGDPEVAAALLDGRPPSEIEALWQHDLDSFRSKRLKYLLYAPYLRAD
jgi:uncharacterized protein YbbC (DUF1343 family)